MTGSHFHKDVLHLYQMLACVVQVIITTQPYSYCFIKLFIFSPKLKMVQTIIKRIACSSSCIISLSFAPNSGSEHYSVSDQYGHAAPRSLHHRKHPEDGRLQLRPHHLLLWGRPERKTDHRQLPRVPEETAARCAKTRGDWKLNFHCLLLFKIIYCLPFWFREVLWIPQN